MQGSNQIDVIDGGAGNDTLFGNTSDDRLIGGLGNDNLQGGQGSNRYEFTRGDGVDTVRDQGWWATDKVALHGYLPSEVVLSRPANDPNTLVMTFVGTTDRITLLYGADGDRFDAIEEIAFDDGTVWSMAQVRAQLVAAAKTVGNDVIDGFDFASETIDGGAGNDTLRAQDGGDTVIGGLGNDFLEGALGDDVYSFTRGDGVDIVRDGAGGAPTGWRSMATRPPRCSCRGR